MSYGTFCFETEVLDISIRLQLKLSTNSVDSSTTIDFSECSNSVKSKNSSRELADHGIDVVSQYCHISNYGIVLTDTNMIKILY